MANQRGIITREGRTELDVSEGDGMLTFVAPAFGYGTYAEIGNQVTNAGLQQPTMSQNASLVHAAWENPKDKYSAEIISKMRSNWLWAFNGVLYVPNEGAYVQDRPAISGNSISMSRKDLVRRLEANDKSVRFVPFDKIIAGTQSSYSALAKNEFVVALAGAEGAEKLAEVSSKYGVKPYVWALTETSSEQKRVASLVSVWDDVSGLDVLGDGFDRGDGFAFGVSPASEAGARKI